MIEETAWVVEVRPGRALVHTVRGTACEGCSARGACAALGGGREARVWAEDPLGVSPGDRVVVAVPEAAVVRAGFWVYLVPVAALVAGAVAGSALAARFGVSPDAGAAALGLAALGGALLASRAVGRRGSQGPRIVRRV